MAAIDEVRHSDSIHRMEYPNDYLSMESVSKLASAKYANAMGGIIASDRRILEIAFHGTAPDNSSEEEIEDSLPNISTYILKKSLKTMIAQGKVKKVGNTKGTHYKLNHR